MKNDTDNETAPEGKKKKETSKGTGFDMEIVEVKQGYLTAYVIGTTPLILNRMSEKAKRELLLPKGRKTAVEKATTLKHDPVAEYRDSAYRLSDESAPTYVGLLPTSFKGAVMTAALDLPGVKKAQIGRLTYVEGHMIGVYGLPKLYMSITRSADMNRTPDVRTRAIIPKWACELSIVHTLPLITPTAVSNLLAAAGMTVGVGDWRLEKGSGNYGLFKIVSPNDPAYKQIIAEGSRAAQKKAFDVPECYDDETSELLGWYEEEVVRRHQKGSAVPSGATV